MKIKSVEWSYPTSPNAVRFKAPAGCWTVNVGERGQPLKAKAGFPSWDEAIKHAQKLPIEWASHFLFVHPEFKEPVLIDVAPSGQIDLCLAIAEAKGQS